jgi:hypothetical protein
MDYHGKTCTEKWSTSHFVLSMDWEKVIQTARRAFLGKECGRTHGMRNLFSKAWKMAPRLYSISWLPGEIIQGRVEDRGDIIVMKLSHRT